MQVDSMVTSSPLSGSLAGRYLAAQLAGDRREALRIVVDEALEKGVAPPDIHMSVIEPAQYEIGRLWQENTISVAQEHVATAISQLVLAYLYPRLPRAQTNGKKVVVACVEGELHDMGARVCADFLEMAGYEVRFLGADVPEDSLVSSIVRERPDAVALSVTMVFHVPAAKRAIQAIRASTRGRTPILVGGHALRGAPELTAELAADGFSESASELVTAVRSALERPAT
jgi:MerR family transcriptional regulator, light-induced transcriptional regulator